MREIYAGDPDNEGVVWPRVAELALLGGLGCGRWLVQLVIDGLEDESSPYRYLVTQATDNSVPFYERMGFVRVGAVTTTRDDAADDDDEPIKKHGGKKVRVWGPCMVLICVADDRTDRLAPRFPPLYGYMSGCESFIWHRLELTMRITLLPVFVCTGCVQRKKRPVAAERGDVVSRHKEHVCAEGETCASIARAYGVEPFDVIFLNQRRFPRLHQHAELRRGTKLQVPQPLSAAEAASENDGYRQAWHVVTEDAPLKKLAELTGKSAAELIALNRSTIKGIALSSVLKRGTRLLTAGADLDCDEYAHLFSLSHC